jgi:sigma-B regulation protein RsbU (phosphoserine phosphatase)
LTRILSPDYSITGSDRQFLVEDALFSTPTSSVHIAAELNKRFQSGTDMLNYFTMAYGILDIREKSMDICLAGHQKPIYIPQGGEPQLIGSHGFPIGIFLEADYQSTIFKFDQGGRLFLHSDGITECMNAEGEEFGLERLQQVLYESSHDDLSEVGERVMVKLEAWKGDGQFDDDISMLAFEIIDN